MTDFRYEIMFRTIGSSYPCDECRFVKSLWYDILDTTTGKRRDLCQKCWDEIKWEAK